MINLRNPEFAEITNTELPSGSPDELRSYLENMRTELCQRKDFKIASHQRFLRRVLSPDSPVRSLLMVHGTGVGKTCTAIQIAEEYIMRPEFQEKKVLVVSSGAVEQNFRTQIFEIDRVKIDTIAGTLESKQCTGRRYLDMLLRIEKEPKNWENPEIRDRLERTADRLINEFYEFTTYATFGSTLVSNLMGSAADLITAKQWVKDNLEGRLIIIDEAHNIREGGDVKAAKELSKGLAMLAQQVPNVTLVLLTATPMFDTYREIEYFINLFLWNDKRQSPDESVKLDDIFNGEGILKEGPGAETFRRWCQDYVSYVKGENPFTFPFRLPPPLTVTTNLPKSYLNKPIGDRERLRYLPLVESPAAGIQKTVLQREAGKPSEEGEGDEDKTLMRATIAVLPENKPFDRVFSSEGNRYSYVEEPFLTPEKIGNHSAKFKRVLESIERSKGVVLVYSNFVTMGAQLFAMALEEHGYAPAVGEALLANPAYSGPTKGKYGLITARLNPKKIERLVKLSKNRKNKNGEALRVIVVSPIASEGIDFRYVRQVHILDPWWNMSRIEQVIGRGLRTCSHADLVFPDQNCTVYLHVVRHGGNRECFDEYTYRIRVEPKAVKIARVRKAMAEYAMDCPLQNIINTLPPEWRNLEITQRRAEGNEEVTYKLSSLMAPSFMNEGDDVVQCKTTIPDEADDGHVRPLSTYLDVRDEMLSTLAKLFIDKPIWDRDELFGALKNYSKESVVYNIQQAIQTGFRFKDSFGRPAVLESKGDLYALAPVGVPNSTLVERTTLPPEKGRADLPEAAEREEPAAEVAPDILDIKRQEFAFPGNARERFTPEVLNSYIFDHVLTDEERKTYMRERPDGLYLGRFKVGDDVLVFGHENTVPTDLAPAQRTAFNAWNTARMQWFISKKDELYGTVAPNGKFAFSKVEVKKDGTVVRFTKKQKQYRPIVCNTGAHQSGDVIRAFAQTIDIQGVGIPDTVTTNEKACVYAELLAREAGEPVDGDEERRESKCFWVTPQELSVLFDNPANRKAFADTFPKK
jgi:hypothetical protein